MFFNVLWYLETILHGLSSGNSTIPEDPGSPGTVPLLWPIVLFIEVIGPIYIFVNISLFHSYLQLVMWLWVVNENKNENISI